MKKTLLTLFVYLTTAPLLSAQYQEEKCGTMEYLKQQLQKDPTLEKKRADYNELIRQYLLQNNASAKRAAFTIPVVVHVLYSADSQNISDQRIFDQIAICNRDFAGLNPHSMMAFSASMKAKADIQFCLARNKPDGSPTNGIDRVKTSVDAFIQNDNAKYSSTGGVDAWDPTKYLNIWVCNYELTDAQGYRFSAYAQFPGSGLNSSYGVVIRYGAMGPTDSNYYRGNGGVLTHELGHCFNLYHIWGDDVTGCGGTDYCDDSPNQAGRTTGLHSGVLTDNCTATSPGIMYMNFMDYSNDILFANFTPKQVERMRANFLAAGALLIPLSESNACTPVTGISLLTAAPELHLYPNPAQGQVTIQFSFQNAQWAELRLMDIYGRTIRTEHLNTQPHDNTFTLNLNSLNKGIYFIELKMDGLRGVVKELVVE